MTQGEPIGIGPAITARRTVPREVFAVPRLVDLPCAEPGAPPLSGKAPCSVRRGPP